MPFCDLTRLYRQRRELDFNTIRNADKYKNETGYVDEEVVFLKSFGNTESHWLWGGGGGRWAGFAAQALDLTVREKARDRTEGLASPGCRGLRPGSSLGCDRARPCSPRIRRDNFHKSPHPPAPL